jgi:F0F1-type ATP synthase membrane subunit c/vacuolar-type H+-ATPase subunit K
MRFLPLLLLLLPFSWVPPALADTPEQDYATSYTVADQSAIDGDILISSSAGLTRTTNAYNSQLFGVLQKNPEVVYRSADTSKVPVARTGLAEVNVTTLNGNITKGDYVTSSPISGKGQKASQSGYVIGVAMQDFSSGTNLSYQGGTYSSGQIQIALRIEYAEINSSRSLSRLFDAFNSALFKNLQSPDQFDQLIRFILAGLIILLAIAVGYLTFSKSLVRSIEAIGRNPLARGTILLAMILNMGLTLAIVLIGVGVALLILRL